MLCEPRTRVVRVGNRDIGARAPQAAVFLRERCALYSLRGELWQVARRVCGMRCANITNTFACHPPSYFYYTPPKPPPPADAVSSRPGRRPPGARPRRQAQHRRREIAAAALPQRGHDGRDCPTSDCPAIDCPTRDSLRSRGARDQRRLRHEVTSADRPLAIAKTPGHRSHSRVGPAACTVWRRAEWCSRVPRRLPQRIVRRHCHEAAVRAAPSGGPPGKPNTECSRWQGPMPAECRGRITRPCFSPVDSCLREIALGSLMRSTGPRVPCCVIC